MTLLLLTLSILLITTLCIDPVTITCKDGVESGSFSANADTCTCTCPDTNTDSICRTLTAVQDAFACKTDCTDDQNKIRTELRTSAAAINPLFAPDECAVNQIVFDSTAVDCTAKIITCDQTRICNDFDEASAQYACNTDDGTCRQRKCTITEDSYGNMVADISGLVLEREETNDGSLCKGEVCVQDTTGTGPEDECSTGQLSLDDLCYYPCILESDNIRRLSSTPIDIAKVFGDLDALKQLESKCRDRNDQLMDCRPENIEPNVISDGGYRTDRVNCGCGRCVERCEFEKRYVHFKDDNGNAKCVLISCVEREETRTAATALSSTNLKESYYNIRRTITETDVELVRCTQHDGTTDPPNTITCNDPCVDGERPFCVYDVDSNIEKTFRCEFEFHCALKAANDDTKFQIRNFVPCRDTTENECDTVDAMRIKDEYVATSQCPLICKCIANRDDSTLGNIEICDTMERNMENLKKRCALKLDIKCRFEDLIFNECPLPTDTDICSKLLCDPDNTPNDPSTGGVCRKCSERFADTSITERDETIGCIYKECDDNGQLIEKRYDDNTRDSKGILRACPRLIDCKELTYNPNGFCGVCPTCDDDDACDKNTLRKGDNACKEDPDDDDTRDKPDGTRDEFVGKIRIKAAVRICADRFFGYTRDDIYGFIKGSVYTIANECSNIDIDDLISLRAYIGTFDYEIVDKLSTDTCDVMLKIVFRVDLCDIKVERLRKLLTCFQELKENDSVDIRARIAAGIQGNTKETRFSDDTTSEYPDKPADEAIVSASATDVAELDLVDMNGDPIEYNVAPTTTKCDNKGCDDQGNGGNAYNVVMAVMLSFIAYFVF